MPYKDPVKAKENKKKNYEKDLEASLRVRREHYYANRSKYLALRKEYFQTHKVEIAAYYRKKHAEDVQYKLARNLRNRLNSALNRSSKVGSAVADLGCSVAELKFYIEGKFQPGMSWANWGEWHIDHEVPLSMFDLTNKEQFLSAVHYTNLQPLWAEDNLKKGNKTNI